MGKIVIIVERKIVIIVEHRLYYLKELINQLIVIKDKKVTSYPVIDITDDFTQTQNLRQLFVN